jgi:hypothetical protein
MQESSRWSLNKTNAAKGAERAHVPLETIGTGGEKGSGKRRGKEILHFATFALFVNNMEKHTSKHPNGFIA